MGLRLGTGVTLVAVALLGFTVATPQDAAFGVSVDIDDILDPRGVNRSGLKDVDLEDRDLGRLLDRIDGTGLDPDLVRNLDPEALAALLDGLTPQELAALGMTAGEAQAYVDRLQDPDLTDEELAAIAEELSEKGLRFANDDADGRFDAGEAAYADVDGDGTVSDGDVRLGVLALLLGIDRGLSETNKDRLVAYQYAGGLGLGRPFTSNSKATASASTSLITVAGYPTDRAMGPNSVVCVQLSTPSLTCHNRTFVHRDITEDGGAYLFRLDGAAAQPEFELLVPDPDAAGVRVTSTVHVETGPRGFVPIPGLTPDDVLVAETAPTGAFYRDAADMLWYSAPDRDQRLTFTITWAVDLGYYDLPVAADVTADDVPAADRPELDAVSVGVGYRIADLAGARDRPYGDAIRALQAYARDFGLGALPDRDEQPNDLLAIAESQVGCARQRATTFTLAAQALGIPARLVVNEAHAFSEVLVPGAGWHLVDLGGCSRVQVVGLEGHEEVMALQDLPYADGEAPPSQADAEADPAAVAIEITQLPTKLRANEDFQIAGVLSSPDGRVPAGIPITFTYNQTKEQPGTPFCTTQSLGDGTFLGTCRLPSGMPPAPNTGWQLVARLAPSVVDGAPSGPAYSDPPFVVQKATTLAVVGPARTSADVPVSYTALVRDEDGAAVVQRSVTLTVDGGEAVTRVTDATGRARFTVKLPVGVHELGASFAGDDNYDPSAGAARIEATTTRIGLKVDQAQLDGGVLTVDGGIAVGAAPTSGRALTASWRNDPDGVAQTRSATSGANGVFRFAFDTLPRPGPGLLTVTDTKSGVAVDLAFARSVDAAAVLDAPARWALGSPVPVTVRITGPADPVPLRLRLDGEVVADVDAGDQSPASVLVTVPLGAHRLELEAGAGVRLESAPVELVVAPVEAVLDPVPVQAPGSSLTVSGRLRFDGQGLGGPVTLRILDATGNATAASDGAFTVTVVVPADAAAGNATAVLAVPGVGHQVEVPVRIQKQANVYIRAPELSFRAFGTTPIKVDGQGLVTVTADGESLGSAGRIALDTKTWLWRSITLRADATPTDGLLAPASTSTTLVVVNPATFTLGPILLAGLVVASHRTTRFVQRRRAHRNRFLPLRPRGPVRLVEPDLPRRVPLVFDPAIDRHLVVRLPRAAPWTVRVGDRQLPGAHADGRHVRIDLARLPLGPHTLRFVHEGREHRLDIAVDDLRSALDGHTLELLRRIGRPEPWPSPMQAIQDGLAAAGATADDAQAVRRHAEESLYTMDGFGRDRFHAYFAALDEAQARRPT